MIDKKAQGKRNRASGARFELKVRKEMEENGWTIAKWPNNVEFFNDEGIHDLPITKGKMVAAKRAYNPFSRAMVIGTGFPDFVAFRLAKPLFLFHVVGVEVKSNGKLSKQEKEKCAWLDNNKIFSKILIASKGEKRGTIEYQTFEQQ